MGNNFVVHLNIAYQPQRDYIDFLALEANIAATLAAFGWCSEHHEWGELPKSLVS